MFRKRIIRKINREDFVYGPSAYNKLRETQMLLGGQLLTDLDKPTEFLIEDFSIKIINNSVSQNYVIYFDLTNIKNIKDIINGTGEYVEKITSVELLHIKKHYNILENHVIFMKKKKFFCFDFYMEVNKPW